MWCLKLEEGKKVVVANGPSLYLCVRRVEKVERKPFNVKRFASEVSSLFLELCKIEGSEIVVFPVTLINEKISSKYYTVNKTNRRAETRTFLECFPPFLKRQLCPIS